MDVIAIPETLREKLGTDGAQALVDLLNRSGRATRDEVVTLAEERFARRLAEEAAKWRGELSAAEMRFERRVGDEAATLWQAISSLEARVSHRLTVQTRWITGLSVAQTGVLVALLSLFLNR